MITVASSPHLLLLNWVVKSLIDHGYADLVALLDDLVMLHLVDTVNTLDRLGEKRVIRGPNLRVLIGYAAGEDAMFDFLAKGRAVVDQLHFSREIARSLVVKICGSGLRVGGKRSRELAEHHESTCRQPHGLARVAWFVLAGTASMAADE